MNNLRDTNINISTSVETKLPFFVAQSNRKFVSFLRAYYESLETKFQPLDIISNLINYYNVGYYNSTDLIESTELTDNLLSTTGSTTIKVSSTSGFPKQNGYIQINDEFIFYETATDTEFQNCHRGTSAFVLEKTLSSHVVFKSSLENPDYDSGVDINKYTHSHEAGSVVHNLAYYFVQEFLRRIKSEIAVQIPERLTAELNIINFLKRIKSFYSSKGSLNAHKILFKILFNDKKVKIRTVNGGTGASLRVFNYSGKVDGIQILSGGINYNSTIENNELLSPPIIEIIGSGTGTPDQNIIPKTASVVVTAINSSGTITGVSISDPGIGYVGPITARVRERSFIEDQIVINDEGTGKGRVEYWDFNTNEIVLYDVEGYFRVDDTIRGIGGEEPVTVISKSYPITPENPEGNPSIQVISLDPEIEYPKDYIFKPSSSTFSGDKLIKCQCILNESKMSTVDRIVSLVQESDPVNGISGVTIESSEFNKSLNNLYEFNIDINFDYKKLYLPQSSVVTVSQSNIPSNTDFILTVDDCYGYPLQDGYVYIDGNLIEYTSRSSNQFFGCKHKNISSINIVAGQKVFEYGSKKYDVPWTSSATVVPGYIVYHELNAYEAINSGTTSLVPPTHTSGIKSDALFGVKWKYLGKNIIKRSLTAYIDSNLTESNPVEFILLGLVSDFTIVDSGSLYDHDSIVHFESTPKNLNSDPLFNSFNANPSSVITNSALNSYNNSTGVHSVYNYGDHVYISTSSIPPYLDSTDNTRKINCTNQKLIRRIPKSHSIQKSDTSVSRKNIGLTVDGVEIQSPYGNTVSYGYLEYIHINTGGEYEVPCNISNQFDYVRYPVLVVNGSSIIKNTNSNTILYLSSKFSSVDLTKLSSSYLTGFTSTPRLKVINNNPNGNPVDFENAVLDLSYNQTTGTIDNILIRNPGKGYVVAPTITIEGGGKDSVNIPIKTALGDVFKFTGSLISKQNYASTSTYNIIDVRNILTTTYKTIPTVTVDTGSGASIKVFTSNNMISTIEIVNEGTNYYTTPTVELTHPTGVDANIIANNDETTGKITSYTVINRGKNYTSPPSVKIIPSGSGASVTAVLKSWTFNLGQVLTNIDNYGGYIYDASDSTPISGNINRPVIFQDNLPKSLDVKQYLLLKSTSSFNTHYSITSTSHSPIIGWAYDGNPIYGNYGYSNPMDKNSAITSMTSKWTLNNSRVGGPSVAEYPLGTFIEDYNTSSTSSKLDEYNGRYCVTPEFPNGVYAYFATNNSFPYFIGTKFYGKYDVFNLCSTRTNDKIPQVFTRIEDSTNTYYPKEITNLVSTKVKLKSNSGKIDSIIIENGGQEYSIGDKVVVDNSESGGIGFSALVSKLAGKNIIGYSFVNRNLENYIEFTVDKEHELPDGDQIDIDYNRSTSVVEYTLNSNLIVNYYSTAKLLNASSSSAKFYLDSSKTIPFFDDNVLTLSSTYIQINTELCPSVLYIEIGLDTYTVTIEKYSLLGTYNIEVDDNAPTKFYIKKPTSFNTLNISTIKYTTKSRSAKGSIVDCIISNKGVGYKLLPKFVTVSSVTGYNAILQFNSSSIGSVKSISYTGFGDSFTSNRTVNYNINAPFTAKVINNFKISSINVINGGTNYLPTPSDLDLEKDYIKINGQKNYPKYQFNINTEFGIITSVDVIEGGYNLSAYPDITVYSDSGVGAGAVLTANIERTYFDTGTLLTCADGTVIKVLNYNSRNSTIVFEYVSGNDFEKIEENTTIALPNGQIYGNLVSIKRAKIYSKNSAYSSIEPKFLTNSGFLSDSTQKLLDSDYYQDWSYTLRSSRNISEWKSDLVKNTHAAGFKVFGKNVIEKRSSVFENIADILRSSVVFKSNLSNKFDLKLQTSDCTSQYLYTQDISGFSVGDYVYGNISGSLGVVVDIINSEYVKVNVLTKTKFELYDGLFVVSSDFIINQLKNLSYVYCFHTGLLQNPAESYYVSNQTVIPNFTPLLNTPIYNYYLTTQFTELIAYISVSDNSTLILKSADGSKFTSGTSETLLISINGVVQNPSTYTVSSNIVTFSSNINSTSEVFVLYHDKLKKITFTGTGLVRTINYTATSSCNLLIFANNVHQHPSSGDYTLSSGNILTFSEDPGTDLYGWYIDEVVTCNSIQAQDIYDSQVLSVVDCELTTTTKLIESNVVRNKDDQYQFSNEILDGTFTANANTVYGYDSSFITTYPEYSSSYVEVLNKISFNGSAKTFALTYSDGMSYTPVNGENNLIVYINNTIIDPDQYSVSGSNITFVQTYASTDNCTILDFISGYTANNLNLKGVNLDRLNVVQDGSRQTFNLSDRGVPQYVKNIEDLFTIKNDSLLIPNSTSQSTSQNKVTLQTAPLSTDSIKLLYFNRQLTPPKTKNVILDPFDVFDGTTAVWPISSDGVLFNPVSAYHLFVVRNGVYQRPEIDYTVSGSAITFTTPPSLGEIVTAYYSYNGLNQNFAVDQFKLFDGVNTQFALTTNYVNSQVISLDNLLVSMDGSYQHPGVDYTVGGATSKYIQFTTAPTSSQSANIVNYKGTDLVNITSRFTQYNTTTLQYTDQSPSVDTNVLLIYVNGVLQVGNAWSFDTNTNRLTFNNFVSLTLDDVTILAFQNQKRTLDKITTTAGVETYNLQINSTTITTDLPSKSDLVVSINGLYQLPTNLYSVSGSTITIPGVVANTEVYIYQIGTQETEIIDYIDDNYSKSTYKLLSNFASVNPVEVSDVLVFRNGVPQNPGVDFVVGNGFITFTTNLTSSENVYIIYCHGTDKLPISTFSGSTITLASAVSPTDYNNLIVYLAGIPQYYDEHFTIAGDVITLSENSTLIASDIFVLKLPTIVDIDFFDDYRDGTRTEFRLYYNGENLIAGDVVSEADILVSKNGEILYPGVEYTINQSRALINFTQAPSITDDIFMIRMHGNTLVTLTATGTPNQYTLDQSISLSERPNLFLFGSKDWMCEETQDFTYVNNNTITLPTGQPDTFGIKFEAITRILDQINTPYNGTNKRFNMFYNQENFMPVGTIENDSVASESSILVTKNGKLLDPGVDYTLQGDIKTQIEFTTAPISTDVISIKSVGSFTKLKTITSGFGGKIYNLHTQTNVDYYPNKPIKRPRKHEYQILVIKDGNIQSPLYDYYVDNNQLVFKNNITSATKLVILDFMGTPSDVEVLNTSYQISVGDQIKISGEASARTVTEIKSPTLLTTTTYSGTYSPSGFSATTTISNGKLTNISIDSAGSGYTYPPIIRTIGSGVSARVVGNIDRINGNQISTPLTIQYSGNNMYGSVSAIATSYAYVYKKLPTSTSTISVATQLDASLTSSAESITVKSTSMFEKNPPIVQVTSSTGAGATFRPYVSNGRIRKVEILSGGSGYNDKDAILTVTGGNGSGCVLELVMNSGTVTAVNVKNSGEGYDTFKAIIANELTEKLELVEYTDTTSTELLGCTRSVGATSHASGTRIYYDFI